ncbi:MAG: hypothetical protein NUW23_09945 [Firmicutes bacterium]|jgi:ABC-2 type transport system permease protein|nr:hypothetical protein [Bacillota bacterium]
MYLAALSVELRRGFARKIRYPLEFASETLAVYLFLMAVTLATKDPEAAASRLTCLLAAFFCLGPLQGPSRLVTDDVCPGAVEQLCVSPVGLPGLALIRDIAGVVEFMPTAAILSLAVRVTAGVRIFIPTVPGLIALVAMRGGMLGLGLSLGALALLFRRVGGLVNLVSMGVFALGFGVGASGPGWLVRAGAFFPYTRCLPTIMAAGTGGAEATGLATVGSLAGCAVLTSVYLGAGLVLFYWAERVARDHGLVGKD